MSTLFRTGHVLRITFYVLRIIVPYSRDLYRDFTFCVFCTFFLHKRNYFLGEINEQEQVRCHLDWNVVIGLCLGNLWSK